MDNSIGENIFVVLLTLILLGSCGMMIYMMVTPDPATAFNHPDLVL
jgi:hypothetical protein